MKRILASIFVVGAGLLLGGCPESPPLLSLVCVPLDFVKRDNTLVLELECGGALRYGQRFYIKEAVPALKLRGQGEPLPCKVLDLNNSWNVACAMPPAVDAGAQQQM